MSIENEAPTVAGEDEEGVDSCICGMEHLEDEVTSDEELPPATGGVTTSAEEFLENEDDIDGCELDFTTAEQTKDEELPVSVGGM
jgi:hypothetical protein